MKKNLLVVALVFLISAGCNIFQDTGVLGILRTSDGGGSWQSMNAIENGKNASIVGLSITEMVFEPNNRQIIYAGSTNGGLWKSENGANSWKQILSKMSVHDFAVDPENVQSIYASGIFGGNGKIVRTKDGGGSWEELYNEGSSKNPVTSIATSSSNTREVYALLSSGALIKSSDEGINWFVVYDFREQVLKVRHNPHNGALYAMTVKRGIAKSTDGGNSWTFISNLSRPVNVNSGGTASDTPRFIKLALDTERAGVMYVTTSDGLFKTVDDGGNWSFLNLPINSGAMSPRAIASSEGGVVAYTSIGNTIYKTVNGGQSWQTQPLPTANIVNKIIIDPVYPQVTYAGLAPR